MTKLKKTAAVLSALAISFSAIGIWNFNENQTVAEAVSFDKQQYVAEVVELVNEERESLGLSPLKNIDIMNYMCDIRAEELTELFSHDRPDGSDCFTIFDDMNVSWYDVGENIAWGYPTPQAVFDGWCNSSGHYENMTSPDYEYIGVSVAVDSDGNLNWVQLFSSMDSSYESFVTTPAETTTTTTEPTTTTVTSDEPITETTTAGLPDILKGDINLDGKTGSTDIVMLKNYLLSETPLSNPEFYAADIDDNGVINVIDLVQLKMMFLNS